MFLLQLLVILSLTSRSSSFLHPSCSRSRQSFRPRCHLRRTDTRQKQQQRGSIIASIITSSGIKSTTPSFYTTANFQQRSKSLTTDNDITETESTLQNVRGDNSTNERKETETDITIRVPKFLDDNDDRELSVLGLASQMSTSKSYPSTLHNIHVQSFLTHEQCAKCLQFIKEYNDETNSFSQPDVIRHTSYGTCDFPVNDCVPFRSYLETIGFTKCIFSKLSASYGVNVNDLSYLDLFVVNYKAKNFEDNDGSNRGEEKKEALENNDCTMDRLEEHRDGSVLSFSVVLTSPDSFEGGGTFFDALLDYKDCNTDLDNVLDCQHGVVRVKNAGDCVLHSGKLLHGASQVTKGERTVIIGFVDVGDNNIREGIEEEMCRICGRLDVSLNRYSRQKEVITKHEQNKSPKDKCYHYKPTHNKYIPDAHSRLKNIIPTIFSSVKTRTGKEYQRITRLKAEDYMLRNILRPVTYDVDSDDDFTEFEEIDE